MRCANRGFVGLKICLLIVYINCPEFISSAMLINMAFEVLIPIPSKEHASVQKCEENARIHMRHILGTDHRS